MTDVCCYCGLEIDDVRPVRLIVTASSPPETWGGAFNFHFTCYKRVVKFFDITNEIKIHDDLLTKE